MFCSITIKAIYNVLHNMTFFYKYISATKYPFYKFENNFKKNKTQYTSFLLPTHHYIFTRKWDYKYSCVCRKVYLKTIM